MPNHPQASKWPEDRVVKLKLLLDLGKSASETAVILHTTRCAVLGKAHREGWKFGRPKYQGVRTAAKRPSPHRDPEKIYRRLSVDFSEEQLADIKLIADRHKISLSESVRTLVDWGFESCQ